VNESYFTCNTDMNISEKKKMESFFYLKTDNCLMGGEREREREREAERERERERLSFLNLKYPRNDVRVISIMHGRIFLWSIYLFYLFIWWANYETLACPINIYNASWSIYIVEHRELLQYVCWEGEGSLHGQAIWNHYLGAICFILIFWKLFFKFFLFIIRKFYQLKIIFNLKKLI